MKKVRLYRLSDGKSVQFSPQQAQRLLALQTQMGVFNFKAKDSVPTTANATNGATGQTVDSQSR